jgi:CYTH domain-containing protein/predicted ATPase
MLNIPKIVVTGGPCSGKTTALAAIVQFCQDHGFYPVIIPEVATELINSGFDRTKPEFQEFILKKILFEDHLRVRAALQGHFPDRTVFIFDRGLLDGRAYVTEEGFAETLRKVELSLVDARDRYAGVIFLDSAAVGAEEFYTLANNTARNESLEEARDLNERTLCAWMGTPHFKQITNHTGRGFDEKITECLKALARILGVPIPLENERKFNIKKFDIDTLPLHAAPIDIVQTYLVGKTGQVERVRARGQHNRHLFFHTIKVALPNGGSHELDRMIDKDEYNDFLIRRDTTRSTLHKTRFCFQHTGQYCELDVFHGNRQGLVLLEVEVHGMTDEVDVPPFLGEYVEETGNYLFSNHYLALPA